MPNTDNSSYERDVIEHLLFGMARARIFQDVVANKPWTVDLAKGTLDVGKRGYEQQILGTFAPGPRSFLWSWANPGNKNWGPSLFAAKQAYARGQHPGYAVLAEREIPENWIHAREVATVVGELTGGHPVYAPAANGTTIYFLVPVPIEPRAMSPAYLPGLLLDFQSIARGNREACVARFFERMGFQVARSQRETSAVRNDGAGMRVFWDDHQRIANVHLAA